MGRLGPFREETKFSGTNSGGREINIHFPCSTNHEQDWQPYPVDPYSCYSTCDEHTYRHTYCTYSFVNQSTYEVLVLYQAYSIV